MAGTELQLIADAARARRVHFTDALVAERVATRSAAEQKRAAAQRAKAGARSVFAGGATNRLNADWVFGPMSADQALREDIQRLRDRSRQLRRDDPYASRYISLCSENIAGPDGMTLHAGNDAIAAAFAEWCRPEFCSVDGRLAFRDHESLAVEVWKSEGEHLVHLVPYPNKFGFALQVLDNDQLDHQLNVTAAPGRNEIRMGVELDQWQRPVAYHLWTAHPTDPTRHRVRERVPAERIVHLYRPLRPGQTRGITDFAPVMQSLRMLGGIQEALLVLQRTAACKMGFLTVDPEKTGPLTPSEDDDGEGNGAPTGQETVSWDAEPGRIEQLPAGLAFESWDPGQPGTEYDPFTRNVLRAVAMGLGVSYTSLTGDLSNANFSSARVGLLSERDYWRREQAFMAEQFHMRVFRAWLRMALLAGAVKVQGYDADRYAAAATFQARGWDWVDPEKDINASLRETDAGLTSLTRIAASKGRDFGQILRERKAEMELAAKLGVPLVISQPKAAPGAGDQAAQGEEDSAGSGAAAKPSKGGHLSAA